MFLSYFRKLTLLTISSILAVQCFAEKIDYIDQYLPQESWIRRNHDKQKSATWFFRRTPYQKLNDLFRQVHEAAFLTKFRHKNMEHVVRQHQGAIVVEVAALCVANVLKLDFYPHESIEYLVNAVVRPIVEKEERTYLEDAIKTIWKDVVGTDLELSAPTSTHRTFITYH